MIVDRRQYEAALPALADCFERCFGAPIDISFLRWRYLDNPFGDLLANIVFDDDGQVLANYSVCPQPVIGPHGESLRAVLSMTTMVDPSLRGQGVFVDLCTELQDHLAETGCDLIYGFPNAASFGGFVRRLGWEPVRAFAQLNAPVRRARPTGQCTRDDNFALDYSWLSVAPHRFHVRRSARYLRWRYCEHPSRDYGVFALEDAGKVYALAVYKTWQDGLDVVELIAPDEDALEALLGDLEAEALRLGLDTLACWMPEHADTYRLLVQRGFVPVEPVTRFGGRWLGVRPQALDWDRWFVQMGDSDVF